MLTEPLYPAPPRLAVARSRAPVSTRYTQQKSVTAKHAEILRGMLKRPENKLCADCKRNDPRWASTNLGCFLCIRCSGIHRGIGVHVTRIKSIDLDTWTPEQIEFIQKWGNKRANAYWERHLRAGHSPPEHKMEAFIRSKYESRKWAMDGPLPDPATLDFDDGSSPTEAAPAARPASTTASRSTATSLLDAPGARPASAPRSNAAPPKVSSSRNALFDLDMGSGSAPSQPTSAPKAASSPPPAPAPKRDTKADILSLFASAPPPRPAMQQPASSFDAPQQALSSGLEGLNLGGGGSKAPASFGGADPWGSSGATAPPARHAAQDSFDGFGDFASSASSFPSKPAPKNDDLFAGTSSWGNNTSSSTPAAKPDPFGDFGSAVWGGGGGAGANSKGASTTKSSSGNQFSDIWA